MAEIIVNENNFEEVVLKNEGPVLVDFWAAWCGPCRMLGPVIAQVADEQEGKVTVAKINVDDNPDLARRFGIRSIPALLLFKDGEVMNTSMGYLPKAEVEAFIGL
jgi:thioredoxin 1